ncbi:MAG: glycosyltransferase family 2 protein [Clostridia bacterium]|nr:glycosyltransferase family 2 protein [Clostridia bacterium]
MSDTVLYLIVPCYNEEKVLPITVPLFMQKIEELAEKGIISGKSRILFVNDGSKDKTWDLICGFAAKNARVIGISQSRNRGHQNALYAGLMEAKDHCDITVTMDCDGQDDLNAIDRMIEAYENGAEIVYGVRNSRKTDGFLKRFTAQGFYRMMNGLGAEIVYNHADFRLVSARVLQEFSAYREVNLFLRGMFPLVGFKSTCIYYERKKRLAGKTHYSPKKMLALALDGITSLSIKPLRFITVLGILISVISFFLIVWAVVVHFLGMTERGWASVTALICFFSGIQLLSVGVVGEYIGKIYLESKARPKYIISERTDSEKES